MRKKTATRTDLQRVQDEKIQDSEAKLKILFAAALRRWENLQPSLRLRKLHALENLLCRDVPENL